MILNVAQANVTEDWPVEIYDHSDHLHELTMQPGNVVYYESARCLHARMNPLRTGEYANMFIHYRPAGDPEWFQRPNPPGTPTPVSTSSHLAAFLERGSGQDQRRPGTAPSAGPTLDCQPSAELQQLLDASGSGPKSGEEVARLRRLLGEEACVRVEGDGTKIHLDTLKDHRELFAWWNRWRLRNGHTTEVAAGDLASEL